MRERSRASDRTVCDPEFCDVFRSYAVFTRNEPLELEG